MQVMFKGSNGKITIVDVGSHTEFFHIIPAIDINKLCSKDGE